MLREIKSNAKSKVRSEVKSKTAPTKSSSGARKRKASAGARNLRATTKDPHGGLTAAGRNEFLRKDGSHLKPGVKKQKSEMSAEEMRRKGSWAVRFYGRSGPLPPLRDNKGNPTRFALTAAAWGEPIPNTVAAARKIAEKGRRLLEAYKKKHTK